MRQTWRWFGPVDKVTLSDVRQAGAEGIVTALHHIAPGEVWPQADITERKALIEAAGLRWDVVESLPVSESIKTGAPDSAAHIQAWIESLHRLAAAGIEVICYNFMPVLDWTRTDLAAPMQSGATALRFDYTDFAGWDLTVLNRAGAATDYAPEHIAAAQQRAATWTGTDQDRMTQTILAGLPGAMEHWDLDTLRAGLAAYDGLSADQLRANLAGFLSRVVPEAEALGMRICAHPDDPPWPLLGLPRILSTEADYQWLVDVVPSPANGITFCTGSLGARGDVDLPGMAERLGPHIHFAHLRNVKRETPRHPGSFFEDDHLAGSTDMVAVVRALMREEARRRDTDRPDAEIPMRPDHGQDMLDDQTRRAMPGYPAIGRLKGLAELRGVMAALRHSL